MNGFISSDVIPRTTTRRLKVIDLNPQLMCVLCGGYYIDATTIIECLHSFCKTCIVRYLETSKFCPICDVQVHKTKPLLNIRSDQTLQDIVYKLVPGLFQREMKRRRDFYAKQPPEVLKNVRSNEERGEVDNDFPHHIFVPDEFISVALEYSETGGVSNGLDMVDKKNTFKRYLRCPVVITVAHIKKLIRAKYGLSVEHRVDLMFSHDCLSDDFMIMDIAYTYSWKRKGPLKLYFRIYERPCKRLKTFHNPPFVPLFGAEAGKTDPSEPSEPAGQSLNGGTAAEKGEKREKAVEVEKDEKKVEKYAELSGEHVKVEPMISNGIKEMKDEKCLATGLKVDYLKKENCSVKRNDNISEIGLISEKKVEAKVILENVLAATTQNGKEEVKKAESDEKKISECLVVALIEKSATVELASKCMELEENNNRQQPQKDVSVTNGEISAKDEVPLLLSEKVNGVVSTTNGKDGDIQVADIKFT